MSSTAQGPGFIRLAWLRWKSLRLPWRRQILMGVDLAGNTFWEFKDAMNANRFRRIVKYSRETHYGDVKISPQWHQWLRHTRIDPPSINEQQLDVARQVQMQQLAARADERWKSQESFLDAPRQQQTSPAIGLKDPGGYAPQTESEEKEGVMNAVEAPQDVKAAAEGKDVDGGRFKVPKTTKVKEDNPYEKARRGGPSENWQPQSWTPGSAQRR